MMPAFRQIALLVFCLSATNILAAPLSEPPRARIARSTTRLDARQQAITESVSFQRVTTTQSTVGTITETCQITLTPIDGDTVRQDKSCTYVVTPVGGTPPPPPDDNEDDPPPPPDETETIDTQTDQGGETETLEDPAATATTDGAVLTTITSDVVGGPAAPTGGGATDAPTGTGGAGGAGAGAGAGGAPPPISELGTNSIPATPTAGQPPAGTDNSAPEAAEGGGDQVPGRRLEVLPIGLGVFAGISVIALIVVGLVTYERTKYRKAFRQRKLAEAGAAMGYSNMSERT